MDKKSDSKKNKHKEKMQKLKESVDASIAAATIEKGIGILLTGDGKAKQAQR